MRISLEEVFLQVTTEEVPGGDAAADAAAANGDPAPTEGGVQVEGEAPGA
jgi:hypothetical protein